MTMAKKTKIVNIKTGEVVHETERPFFAQFDEEKGYLFWNRKSFQKMFSDVEFPEEMTFVDRGRMVTLAKKIWSNTNMLAYRGNGGIKPYDIEQIGRLIGLQPRQARNFIDKMIRLGVMAKVEVKSEGRREIHYYVNPIYFFSSNRLPLNLYLIFRHQLDEVLPDWVKRKFAEIERGEQNG